MTSVASLPASPQLPLPFIDRSGRPDVSSRTFGKAARQETAPTPHTCQPARGGEGMKSKSLGRGPGRRWGCG